MGNSTSRSILREPGLSIKPSIATVKSNFILAMHQGHFYPCVIIRNAETITEGLTVYFFHNNQETEIPSTNVIGNLKALLNCEVSFTDDSGLTFTGIIRATDTDNQGKQPMNFFVSMERGCRWVALPYIFLSKEQARIFITVKSNIVLALYQGHFYPCLIISDSETITDNLMVSFLHIPHQTEIPSTHVIGDLTALLNCSVSFTLDDGVTYTGIVTGTDTDDQRKQPMNFFVETARSARWVTVPNIFMNKEQARVFMCEG